MIYTITLNTAIDKIIKINGTLTRKHNNRVESYSYDIGGKATHISVVLSSLQVENIATGFIGEKRSDFFVSLLEDKGVACNFVMQDGTDMRETIILLDDSGQGSMMVTDKGFTVSDESLHRLHEFLKKEVHEDDFVVIAGGIPNGIDTKKYKELLEIIKDKGAKLIVDATGEYLHAALPVTPFLIKPNEFEFEELVGRKLLSIDDYIVEMKKLNDQGIEVVVVSLGKEGSFVAFDNKVYRIYPPTVKEKNDTGCGDVFLGGVIYGLYKHSPIDEVFRFASAISASKAMQESSSDFSLKDIEMLEREVKIEEIEVAYK